MPDIIKKACSYLLTCLLLAITSCNLQETAEKAVDKNKNKFAREFIDGVIDGDSTILRDVDPSILTDEGRNFLNRLNKAIGNKPYKSVKIVGLNKHFSYKEREIYTINYEYEFERGFVFFSIKLSPSGQSYTVRSFNADISRESFIKNAEFSFKDKGIIHYLVLLLAIAIPILIIVTLVVVIKTKIRRKWLWLLAVLLCNFGPVFNWATGTFKWEDFKFIILGLGIEQGNVNEAWNFTVAIPIGAMIFWMKRRRLKREEQEYNELIAMYPDNG
jgi:hypothetical protein